MRLVLISLVCAACTTGDKPTEPNGRLCGTTFSTNGTFTPDPSAAPNPDGTGCWPYGTWTYQMAVVENDCSPAPTPLAMYQIKVTQMINMDMDIVPVYSYLTDPAARSIVKVSEGGSGLCEGEVDIYSADGKTVYTMKPELNGDNTITGDGEYAMYGTNQWPYDN